MGFTDSIHVKIRKIVKKTQMPSPVVLLTVTIVMSVIALIGAAVFGFDQGVLLSMGRREFARGLIAYLFSVVTIGTAAVLVLAALTRTGQDAEKDRQFQNGKEVLSLLLGIFGTIVGYYFGSETAARNSADAATLSSSPLDVSPSTVRVGEKLTVRAFVTGGSPPYRYSVGVGDERRVPETILEANGWLIKEINLRQLRPEEPLTVRVIIMDTLGSSVEQTAAINVPFP
jgi:hypothetical protein